MVLNEFLQADALEFRQTVKEWPADLYDIDKIIPQVLDKVRGRRPCQGQGSRGVGPRRR